MIASSQLVTCAGLPGPGTVVVDDDGRIARVLDGVDPSAEVVDGWIVPGFVDTHCHGGAGADFASPDSAAVARAIDVHRRHGSTTLFASTVTEEMDEVIAQIERMKPLVASGDLAGIHLEGPFLAEGRKGAHNIDLLRDPSAERVERILDASDGAVRMITLAPEREGGLEAVARFTAAGVVAAFGHSDADAACTRQAVEAGSNVATHLFNAMGSIHHRNPGPVPVLLDDPRVVVELICDGVHLAPEVVAMAIDAAGPQRVALVTDAMSATCQADGDYQLGSLQVAVRGGVARIVEADGNQGAIAGSTLTMDRAFSFVVNEVGLDVPTVAQMASATPARVHGLTDVGQLRAGAWADLCVLDGDAQLVRVMRHGRWLD